MAEVFEPVVRIDTGDSEVTVKSLKKEITTLRDEILNLEKGSEEYTKAVKTLQDDQRKLDEVMSLTKKTATALDGSYDALVQQMSLLKKEWRATNDVARRNELSKQIAEINNELKEMDAEIGNFQRNVGNYVSHWEGMTDVTRDFGEEMRNAMEAVEPVKAKFESVQKIAGGLASGFAAVQGAAALLNIENENLERSLVKVQAAMALAQGIGGVGDLVEGLGKAKVAFAGLTDKIKVLSKTMGKAGWIGVILTAVTAIAALTTHLIKNKKEVTENDTAIKDLNRAMIEGADAAADQIAELKVYEQIATDINRTEKERNEASAEVLRILGESINTTNIAAVKNGEYASSIDDVTESLIAQAKAEAAMELIKEKQIETLKKQEEARQRQQEYLDKANKQETEGVKFGDRLAAWGNNMAYGQGALGVEYMSPQEMNESQIKDLRQKAAAQNGVIDKLEQDFNDYVSAIINSVDMSVLVKNKPTPTPITIVPTPTPTTSGITRTPLEQLPSVDSSGLIAQAEALAEAEIAITERKNERIILSEEERKERQIKIMNEISTALSAAGSLTQGILEITQAAAEKDGEISEKEAKRIKGLQYATATINMLQGAISAYAAAQTIPPPAGPIIGGVNAAAVIAMGTANLMKIRNTDLTGAVTSGAMGAVTPNSNVYGTDIPFSYVRNVTSASETDALNQDTKVYVLESDITKAVNKQKVRVEESSF